MSVQWRNALIGFGLAFGISLGLSCLGARGTPVFVVSTVFAGLVWMILSMLSGNRKMQLARDADRQAALAAGPPAGMGLVYVYRKGFYGRALGFDVVVDTLALGQLKSPMFARRVIAAGTHTMTVDVTGFAGSQLKGGSIRFEIRAGETQVYRLKQQVGMLQGQIQMTRESDTAAALAGLRKVPMIVEATGTGVAAMPPSAGTAA